MLQWSVGEYHQPLSVLLTSNQPAGGPAHDESEWKIISSCISTFQHILSNNPNWCYYYVCTEQATQFKHSNSHVFSWVKTLLEAGTEQVATQPCGSVYRSHPWVFEQSLGYKTWRDGLWSLIFDDGSAEAGFFYVLEKCPWAFLKPNRQVHDAICWISKTVYATKWTYLGLCK